MHFEEDAFLTKLIELWIAVEEAGRNELVEYSHHKRWEYGEENIVERQRPRFDNDLPGESILEGIL